MEFKNPKVAEYYGDSQSHSNEKHTIRKKR